MFSLLFLKSLHLDQIDTDSFDLSRQNLFYWAGALALWSREETHVQMVELQIPVPHNRWNILSHIFVVKKLY